MPTSGTAEMGLRLLGAFHDLSGGNPTMPVPTGDAAPQAGIEARSVECDIAVRYLLNQGYLKAADTGDAYTLTIPGKDRVKEMRGIGAPKERRHMSEKTQQRLETLFSAAIGIGLSRLVAERYIQDLVPEQRGIKDDVLRALFRAGTTATSTVFASVLVRQVAKALG